MAGLGRFLTAARLAEQIAGEHPYGYAFNNPIDYTDPTGLQPQQGCWLDWLPFHEHLPDWIHHRDGSNYLGEIS
jgi:hypothetical protein